MKRVFIELALGHYLGGKLTKFQMGKAHPKFELQNSCPIFDQKSFSENFDLKLEEEKWTPGIDHKHLCSDVSRSFTRENEIIAGNVDKSCLME